MTADDLVKTIHENFCRIYLGGIPSLFNDDGGAFLSFICVFTAAESLAGFYEPDKGNGARFKAFVKEYFPSPLSDQAEALWTFRNAAVHDFSTGEFKLVHHRQQLHLTRDGGRIVLNAEDFYAALVAATRGYFAALEESAELRAAFARRIGKANRGVLAVGPLTGSP